MEIKRLQLGEGAGQSSGYLPNAELNKSFKIYINLLIQKSLHLSRDLAQTNYHGYTQRFCYKDAYHNNVYNSEKARNNMNVHQENR